MVRGMSLLLPRLLRSSRLVDEVTSRGSSLVHFDLFIVYMGEVVLLFGSTIHHRAT